MLKKQLLVTLDHIDEVAGIVANHRSWHADLQRRFTLHPAVVRAIQMEPLGWHETLLQWPHQSTTDPKLLAYTRNEEHGYANRQTRTAVGKYIKQQFPSIPDHVIRDMVHEHVATESCGFKFVTTTEEMVNAVQHGPHSCMQWEDYTLRSHGEHHPYEAYAPQFGWSMAIRELEGEIVSRALVLDHEGGKCFVRAYGEGSHDEELREWLKTQGVNYLSSWPYGAKLAQVLCGGSTLFPYIDGSHDCVDIHSGYSDGSYLRITDDGEYTCSCTDGTAEHDESEPCDECGDRVDEDDQRYVGRQEEDWVCSHCCNRLFTYVEGRGNRSYYVRDEDAVEINSESYDRENPPRRIVLLADGDTYAFKDECVEINDEWYLEDDDAIVCLGDDDYALKDHCWLCEGSSNWYRHSEVDPVEIEGLLYHPDEVPDPDEEHGGYDKPQGSIANAAQEVLPLPDPDDPYAELKAARDAGKEIEMDAGYGWGVIPAPNFTSPPEMYRVKPDPYAELRDEAVTMGWALAPGLTITKAADHATNGDIAPPRLSQGFVNVAWPFRSGT